MGEAEAMAAVDEPVTAVTLVEDLQDIGVEHGDTVLVHSSMGSIGWVCGGAPAVVDALMEVISPEGTLVMPTFTTQYSDPTDWENPPVPDDWIRTIRQSRPPYRPAVTPTRGMGAIPECFRSYPEVRRSRHPLYSVSAWGANANSVVRGHAYDHGLGDDTPLAAVYALGGKVLQLGTDHKTNSSLHLAEYRAKTSTETVEHAIPVMVNGDRERIEFVEVDWSTEDFPALGEAFEREHEIEHGTVGAAETKLIDQRDLVDFGVEWLQEHR